MGAAHARTVDVEAEPVSQVRPAMERTSSLPLPLTLLITDLLLGASYAEDGVCTPQHHALRPLLQRLLQVDEIPEVIEERIASFDPTTFDAEDAAKKFVDATGAGNRVLLEIISESCQADSDKEALHEDAYWLGLEVSLRIAKAEYQRSRTKNALQGEWKKLKRAEDLILGSIALGVLGLPMLAIAAGVRATSPGPALFVQKRYGEGGKEFGVYKFRSMSTMDNGGSVKQATKGDARITPFGAFLRRTSLDELPQLLNVLRGEMSLVGPRPHATAHNEMYRQLIVKYMQRHQVKPGITGLAQVNGWRGETDTLEKMVRRVDFDLTYIETWSLLLDVKIMFLTIFGRKVRQNAY